MAAVLAATGAFVYLRVGGALLSSVDANLVGQAQEAVQRANAGHGLVDPDASERPDVVVAGRAGRRQRGRDEPARPCDPAASHCRGRGTRFTTDLPGLKGEWRVLEHPATVQGGAGDRRRGAVSCIPRGDAAPAGARVRVRGARRAAARDPRRLRARGSGAPAGRGDEEARGVDQRRRPGSPAAGAGRARRARGSRRDAQRHAGAARGRVRARATVPERCEPRAAHAAHAPARGARAGACGGRARGSSSNARCARRPRRPSGCRCSPTTCFSSRRRTRAASRSGPCASRRPTCSTRCGSDSRFAPPSTDGRSGSRRMGTPSSTPIRSASGRRSRTSSRTRSTTARAPSPCRGTRTNSNVELHVTDEGPGFPHGFLERAFDRFSRADDARTAGGTGLGLAIVELIARAHGGEAVRREPSRGRLGRVDLAAARVLALP